MNCILMMNKIYLIGRSMLILKNCAKKLRKSLQNQNEYKQLEEWGISLSISKILQALIPKGFLWRLTSVNIVVIAGTIVLSGLAIYHTACFLVDGIGNFSVTRQEQFNTTLFQYVFRSEER